MAMKQRRVERGFKRAHLPADSGLTQVQRISRAGEASRIGNRMKDA